MIASGGYGGFWERGELGSDARTLVARVQLAPHSDGFFATPKENAIHGFCEKTVRLAYRPELAPLPERKHPSSTSRSKSRCDLDSGETIIWGALGEGITDDPFVRPMAWGPHEVGGAEARPKRLLNIGRSACYA